MATNPEQPKPPQGVLSFVYHCYYNIDGTHERFMDDARNMMKNEFGLPENIIDKIIDLGQNDDDDSELARKFSRLLTNEFIKNANFRHKIW